LPIATAAKYLWASPASAIGAVMAVAAGLLGAQVRMHTGVLEVSLAPRSPRLMALIDGLPFAAITLGHVVLASSGAHQDRLRVHERAHVAQYEAWGALFLLAYPAECLVQGLWGRHPYRDNRFEVCARAAESLGPK
jgi:hypothetical protein